MQTESLLRVYFFLCVLHLLGSFTTLYTGQNVYIVDDDVGRNLRYYSALGYLLIIGLVFYLKKSIVYFFIRNPWFFLVIFYFLLSTLWAIDFRESFRMWNSIFFQTVLGLAIVFSASFRTVLERILFISKFFVLLSLLFSLSFPDFAKEAGYFDGVYEGALKGFLSSKNVFGAVISMSSIIIYFSIRFSSIYGSIFNKFVFFVSIVLLALSFSATSWAVFFVSIFLIEFMGSNFVKNKSSSFRFVFLIVTIFSALLMIFFMPILVSVVGRDLTFSGRTDLWAFVLDFASYKIVFGYGLNSFWREMLSNDLLLFYGYWNVAQAHNGFLEALLSGGIIGFLLTLFIYCQILYRSYKLWIFSDAEVLPIAVFCLVFANVLLVQNLTESSFPYSLRIGGTFLVIVIWFSSFRARVK